jgi:chorismate-pyruvate lyase
MMSTATIPASIPETSPLTVDPSCPSGPTVPAAPDPEGGMIFSAWWPRPALEVVPGNALPEPYRTLLDHRNDMTSTLQDFHREPLELEVLARREVDDVLSRRVVLVGERSGLPVEFGAIRIDLGGFPDSAREIIRAGKRPLGAILADFDIPYRSRPKLFLKVEADREIEAALRIGPRRRQPHLFGRENALLSPNGRMLAEVIEILPPIAS